MFWAVDHRVPKSHLHTDGLVLKFVIVLLSHTHTYRIKRGGDWGCHLQEHSTGGRVREKIEHFQDLVRAIVTEKQLAEGNWAIIAGCKKSDGIILPCKTTGQ